MDFETLLHGIAGLPGVQFAAVTDRLPRNTVPPGQTLFTV